MLPAPTRDDIEVGLKYINNDACYPAIIVVGQLMAALLSGKYDVEKQQLSSLKQVVAVVRRIISVTCVKH